MPSHDTPKPHCNGEWTPARFRAFIVSALRRASCRWAPKHLCRKQARIARNRYRCAACSAIVGNKDTHVDHVEPVIDPARGFEGWDQFIARLFVEVSGYRLICKACHAETTAQQREVRKLAKQKNT